MKDIEENLVRVVGQKLASLADCIEQHDQLTVRMLPEVERSPHGKERQAVPLFVQTLSEAVETQRRRLKDLKECCTDQSCYRRREATLAALWRRLSRLHRCTWTLATRSRGRIREWSEISAAVRLLLLLRDPRT